MIEVGSSGLWFKPDGDNLTVIGYLSNEVNPEDVESLILRYLNELKILNFQADSAQVNLRKIKDKDWIEEFKTNFEPIFVTDDIVILSNWDKSDFPDKIVIRIKPGMAFGTGAHPTTQLCMRAIKRFVESEDRVLDVGCGSGILSILSAKLGASFVLALDIDQDAIENANENLALNGIENTVVIRQSTVCATIPQKPFDLAVANLNKKEIFESFENIKVQVKNEGVLIFSGILQAEENEFKDFLENKKWKLVETTNQDEWACFVCRDNS